MNKTKAEIDFGILIRRSLFFLVLVVLTLGNLFVMFRGLNSQHGMDQAQIAREISRGNGFVTKMIRPVDYNLSETGQGHSVPLKNFKDTYHAPLNPLVNAAVFKVIGADKPGALAMADNQLIFPMDRVVASISTVFFLLAIGVNYLLISRIFDAKIAGVCAIVMLFSQSFWDYSLSGLPQMLMLFLFSSGMYFAYRAVEATNEDKLAIMPALVAGVFFTLLAFTHWVTVWIALGYIIFAAVTFRPRGFVGAAVLILLLGSGAFIILRNQGITGSPFGTAFLTLYNGLGSGSEAAVMRTTDLNANPLVLDGLLSKVVQSVLIQIREIVPLLGGIVVAPLFFLCLIHPFKNPSIAMFRWALLAMWLAGALGLAFFGISGSGLDPNQTHLLFAPLMTAYGVAFVSILWTRLDGVVQIPMMRNAHLIVICIVCALPLALELPRQVRIGMTLRDRGGYPHWPPYYAPGLNSANDGLRGWVAEDEVVFSDQPWAVAWYADRISIWLPPTKEGFLKLETVAADSHTPAAGILVSPSSHGAQPVKQTIGLYRDFAALVLNGGVINATNPPGFTIHDKASRITEITTNYAYLRPVVGMDMIFYSDRPLPLGNTP